MRNRNKLLPLFKNKQVAARAPRILVVRVRSRVPYLPIVVKRAGMWLLNVTFVVQRFEQTG
jgi:hypothetical protein